MKVFRVFLSSTFEDFRWERTVINRELVAQVNRDLQPRGIAVDVVDLRWGVSAESGLGQDTVEICLREIRRCCIGGGQPALVVLQGERTGWLPLPTVLSEEDFRSVEAALGETSQMADQLAAWYRRDENFVPVGYRLVPRTGPHVHDSAWQAVERDLRNAVLSSNSRLKPELVSRFTTSMTELEVACALELESTHNPGCISALRRERDPSRAGRIGELVGTENERHRAGELWQKLVARLGSKATSRIYRSDAEPELDTEYRAAFAEWFSKETTALVDSRNGAVEPGVVDALSGAAPPSVARRVERHLLPWLGSGESGVRLLFGNAGAGKSSVVRRLLDRTPRPANVVHWLLGRERRAIDPETFFRKLLELVGPSDAQRELAHESVADRLCLTLRNRREPLELHIDAIERVSWRDAAEALSWVPPEVVQDLSILVATSSAAIRDVFISFFGEAVCVQLDEMDDAESRAQVVGCLETRGRRLQPRQLDTLLAATRGTDGRALINSIAIGFSDRLHSNARPNFPSSGLDGWLDVWRVHLSSDLGHGRALVDTTLAMLCASRSGVPENVVIEIISEQQDVSDWLAASFPHYEVSEGFPRTVMSRLLADTEGVVTTEVRDGRFVLDFAHRSLQRGFSQLLGRGRIEWARRRLGAAAHDEFVIAKPKSEWAIAEVLYQPLRLGSESIEVLKSLVCNVQLLLCKCSEEHGADMLAELDMFDEMDCFGDRLLGEYVEFMRRETALVASFRDADERRELLWQKLIELPRDATFRGGVSGQVDEHALQLVPRVSQPTMNGLVQLRGAFARRDIALLVGDQLVLERPEGGLAIVDSRTGRQRRSLPGHAGVVRDVQLMLDRTLLTCGDDGEVAISNVTAGRDILRRKTGLPSVLAVRQLPSGGLLAVDDSTFVRLDGDGAVTGHISAIGSASPERIFVLADVPEPARRSEDVPLDMFVPLQMFEAFGSGFQLTALDDDRLQTVGRGGGALWSFDAQGPLMLIRGQGADPKHLVFDGRNLLVVTTAGGILAWDLKAEALPTLLQRSGLTPPLSPRGACGGTSELSKDRLFVWSLSAPDLIQTAIVDTSTGAIESIALFFGTDALGQSKYFRGHFSSVPRGIIEFGTRMFAWSGDGAELLDPESATITPLTSWRAARVKVEKLDEERALVVRSSAVEVIRMATGEVVASFSHFDGELRTHKALGGGKFVVGDSRQHLYFWDVMKSLRWFESASALRHLAALPSKVSAAVATIDEHVVLRLTREDEDDSEFEAWTIGVDEVIPGKRIRAHGHFVARDEPRRKPSGLARFGEFALTWGEDGRVRVGTSETYYERYLDGVSDPLHCCRAHTNGGMALTLLCVSARESCVVFPTQDIQISIGSPGMPDSSGTSAPLADGPVRWVSDVNGVVFVWTDTILWQVDVSACAGRSAFAVVLRARELMMGLPGWEVLTPSPFSFMRDSGDVVALGSGVFLAFFHASQRAPDVDASRTVLVTCAFRGAEILSAVLWPRAYVDTVTNGAAIVNFPDEPSLVVTYDALRGTFLSSALPAELSVDGRTTFGAREHCTFTADLQDGSRLFFESDRIRVTRGDERGTWFAPSRYEVLDWNAKRGRVIVRTRGGATQVLDVVQRALDGDSEGARSTRIQELLARAELLRLLGRPQLARALLAQIAGELELSMSGDAAPLAVLAVSEMLENQLASGTRRNSKQLVEFLDRCGECVRSSRVGDPDLLRRIRRTLLKWRIAVSTLEQVKHLTSTVWQEAASAGAGRTEFLHAAAALVRRGGPFLDRVRLVHEVATARQREAGDDGDSDGAACLAKLGKFLSMLEARPAADAATDWSSLVHGEAAGLLRRAAAGDARAASDLGALFGRGEGVERNSRHAMYWYHKAVERGHALAAYNASQMHERGEGAPKDLRKAYEFMKLAAERGLTMAKTNLGHMLIRGDGTPVDFVAAHRWLGLGHADGDDEATKGLAALHAAGLGVPRSPRVASELLAPLVARGDPDAIRIMARLHGPRK